MWSDDRIADATRRAIAATEADAVEVSLYLADRNISRFADSSLRQNMSELSGQLTIRAWMGRRSGVAATTNLDDDGIVRAARLARTIAAQSEESEHFAGVYDDAEALPAVESYDPELASMEASDKAAALGDIFRRGQEQGIRYAGTHTTLAGRLAVANSSGLLRVAPFTTADALLIALTEKHSGFATQISRTRRGLNMQALAEEAATKATMLSDRAAELPPGEYDVILEPAALAEIFEWLSMITFNGRSFEDGSSFLLGSLGERVLQSEVTISDDAVDGDFMPFPFDLEGRPKRRVDIIRDGTALTPTVDSQYARRFALTPTASCSDLGSDDHGMPLHLSMSGGSASREELIASCRRGIWVTRFHYINGLLEPKSALMTGTTRDGTFLIEDGKPVARLANLRWTQSIVEAFQRIEGMTAERRAIGTWWNPVGGTITPTLKIRGWKFTGVQRSAE